MNQKGKKLILAVEDVRLFQLFLKQSLESEDYELLFTETGRQALDTVMQRDVDLLILDLALPDINGLEVLRKIRRLTRDIQSVVQMKDLPVIILTAYPKEEVRLEVEKLGVVAFLSKPIKEKKIREIVDQILKGECGNYAERKLLLCVDSEPRVQKFYKGVLSANRWQVICASNGIEALEAVEFNNPHLIITELNLPEMGGLELIQSLKEENRNIPVIVVSSSTDEQTRKKVEGMGISKYLTKPFHLNELRKSIEESLKK